MRFDEKINVMLANGKLTAEQAQSLRNSLQGQAVADAKTYHLNEKISPMVLVVAIIAYILIASFLSNNGQDTGSISGEIQNVAETINQSGKVGEMNKSASTTLGVIIIGLPALLWFVLGYNNLVSKEEDVMVAWSQVETNYQRRADLIPNLVNSVKSYVEHEGKTFTDIASLRANAQKLNDEQDKAKSVAQGAVTKLGDDTYMENLAKAQAGVSEQLKGLMVSVEAYPNLRSSDQFIELQAELEGTENRINVARMAFNERVGDFNSAIRRLPGNLMAIAGGFQRKAYFKADEGANKAVNADFSAPKIGE